MSQELRLDYRAQAGHNSLETPPGRPEFLSSIPIEKAVSRYGPIPPRKKVVNVGYDPSHPLLETPLRSRSAAIVIHDLVSPYLVPVQSGLYHTALLEADRLLTNGGRLVVTTPGHDNLPGYQRIVERIAERTGYVAPAIGADGDQKGTLRAMIKKVLPDYRVRSLQHSTRIHFPTVQENWDLLATLLPFFEKKEKVPLSEQDYVLLLAEANAVLEEEQDAVDEDRSMIDVTVATKPKRVA